MEPNLKYSELAEEKVIEKTVRALEENNFKAKVLETSEEAKREVLNLIPKGAEVFTMTSRTLETLGLDKEINESDNYDSVRKKLSSMDKKTQGPEMSKLGAAPEWTLASVHAITEDGHLLIASNTGSQLSAEAYSGKKVVFVVGAQKIVSNLEEGFKRIREYSYPLEDRRAREVYGSPSAVNKILIINKEVTAERITIILVKQNLGF